MSAGFAARLVSGSFLAAAVALCSMQPVRQSAMAASTPAPRSFLRVGMWTLWHDREAALSPGNSARGFTVQTCETCARRTVIQPVSLHAVGNSVRLLVAGKTEDVKQIETGGVVTFAAHGERVTLSNAVVITARAGVLVFAVRLPVESYVERVVASESGSGDSLESLKALAIVVRSYALHESHGHTDYNLCDSTHCQLLHWSGGAQARSAAAHAATLATAEETLWFHKQRALGYFHKDCGGRTATLDEIWPGAQPVAYLPSRVDPYCVAHGGRQWSTELTRTELTTVLAAHGLVRPGWRDLSIVQRGESGRAVTLRLDSMEISAEEFRLAVGESMGWNRIPSTWFEVSRTGDNFLFHGRGWGHGVGLCQSGAAAMAAQGRSAQQILAQYFPGAVAADEATGHEWQSFSGRGFVLESLDARDATYLPEMERARAEAAERSGLNTSAPVTVRAFTSTAAFREATLAPGWVAAFTEGAWIGTQPLRTLSERHLLAGTLRHEFLHSLLEGETGVNSPLWLREGLVEVWSEEAPHGAPALPLSALDTALTGAATEAEAEAAHRAAAWYAARLLERYGREQVLTWLRSGIPAGVVTAFGQR
ncbi:MAG TPA: SpoIID/LytB domain-containing protein [Terracidiphilus sp.]|nr:SpoIID/LytB domain-containing protein [Terracidiphilus sp.]